jgi:hypothetical protein
MTDPDKIARMIGKALFPNSLWEWVPPTLREKLEEVAKEISKMEKDSDDQG